MGATAPARETQFVKLPVLLKNYNFNLLIISYYILKHAVNTKETGPIYPQVQKMVPGYDYKAFNSVHALSREADKLPNYDPNLDYFILHSKAMPSDLLSVSVVHGGFLISKKFKAIIEQFILPTHRFYPAKVHYKMQVIEYYWMHIICNLTDMVDYPNSSFFVYHNYSKNLGYVDISSKDELIQKRKNIKDINPGKTVTIWAEKITLKQSFNKTIDLFEISYFDDNCYISERLQQAIADENITGCTLTQAKNLIV